jgi:hypothetical protein
VAELTLVMAVYGQPQMLRKQIETIVDYPDAVLERLNVVVVDDCGDPPVDLEGIRFFSDFVKSVKLFRVDKDIPWNQMGARNLGMQHSEGHCLLIDPDMVFDGVVMARMIEAASKLARGRVIKWGLRHVNTGKLDMSSPNTWLLHREDFFAVGGYDEDFAGNKGWSDVQFLDIMRGCYKIEERPDLWAHFHSTASVPDAMVTSLDRSTGANRKKRVKKVAQARAAGGWARWAKTRVSAERLRFPWTQLFPKPSETSAPKS